jgi:sialic acid synthase SpsE
MGQVFIVAEIGIAHGGNIIQAKRLVNAAKLAGANSVKFQLFSCFAHLKPYEFKKEQWVELFAFCRERRMDFFVTPFDREAVKFLDRQGQTTWKIPSNPVVVNNPQLLEQIAKTKNRKLTIISTGISEDNDIQRVLNFFDDKDVVIMHCVSKYPCPIKELNLERIKHLKKKFGHPVGFSDHSISITAPLEAVKLGAEVIEKHLTLNRNGGGPDDSSSLEPHQFKRVVEYIRRGNG